MNMNKEYRTELKQLAKVERKLSLDYKRLERECDKKRREIKRSLDKGFRATARALVRVTKRRGILEGRLS